jgi:hypothetical protein
MSNLAQAAHAPSIPDHIEEPNNRRRCATSALAERLRRIADELRMPDPWGALTLERFAWRLSRCARAGRAGRGGTGWRCGATYCPRCSRQTAIKYRKRLQRRMRSRVASGAAPYGFAMLTLTAAASSPTCGFKILRDARVLFCRKRPVCAVAAGGEGHVEVEPAIGGDAGMWNVHLHAIVELRHPLRTIDTNHLEGVWTEVLARFGTTGRLVLKQAGNLKAESFKDGHR